MIQLTIHPDSQLLQVFRQRMEIAGVPAPDAGVPLANVLRRLADLLKDRAHDLDKEPILLHENYTLTLDFVFAEHSNLAQRNQCCYIGEDEVQCLGSDEFGGFCAFHDELIYQVGGDNSDLGSQIIRRSALYPRGPK